MLKSKSLKWLTAAFNIKWKRMTNDVKIVAGDNISICALLDTTLDLITKCQTVIIEQYIAHILSNKLIIKKIESSDMDFKSIQCDNAALKKILTQLSAVYSTHKTAENDIKMKTYFRHYNLLATEYRNKLIN